MVKAFLFLFIIAAFSVKGIAQNPYPNNRAPLVEKPYLELPLGAIQARGWLKEQLVRQKDGITGNLDELYPLVMGERNGWLGGDGDQWERGPYWIDGLLPLAYILDDEELKEKIKPWIEWSINNQQEDGYFGPIPPEEPYASEVGIQRSNIKDWWPKMVMLKVLQQYYSATGDPRVIKLMTNYFKYQLKNLPETPLDHWTFWGSRRGGDNLMVVHWLYNLTGESFLLELAEVLHEQTFDWADVFLNQDNLPVGNLHCVNVAQGMKEPVIYYQQSKDSIHLKAVEKGFSDLMRFNGHPHGLYGGDELLHGTDPTQGSELCSAVEMMFSLEKMLSITGNLDFADRLERITFNALPTQATDNYMERQYFQQANQVMVSRQTRNFSTSYEGTGNLFGLLTGYPCCTSNMHQGWPKYTQNLWYATADTGLATIVYGPSEVTAQVADGVEVHFVEETNYPFEESIRFTLTGTTKEKVRFPFHLRVPSWCREATVVINGKEFTRSKGKTVIVIDREWQKGDQMELKLPMHLSTGQWHERSLSVEHGPLVYALKIEEDWKRVQNTKDPEKYGEYYYEVHPKSDWNYGLVKEGNEDITANMEVLRIKPIGDYPWSSEGAPVIIKAKAQKVPYWGLYNETSGPLPFSRIRDRDVETEVEEITLIPYGSSTLRISAFPVTRISKDGN